MVTKLTPKKELAYYAAVKKLQNGKRKGYLDRLEVLYELEHGNCGDNTCSMEVAFQAGYGILAYDMFASSGAASSEFYELYRSFPKSALKTAIDLEIECFNMDPDCDAIKCKNDCGAYIYYYTFQGDTVGCYNCGKDFSVKDLSTVKKINKSLTRRIAK